MSAFILFQPKCPDRVGHHNVCVCVFYPIEVGSDSELVECSADVVARL